MILGTAGHVDHGKTALVKALTGVDTDRLEEEKRRGITIDLGFAPLRLDADTVIGVVDVPGHEAFIRNMLAGATGMDLALLVVAADEGVMPQTREHLDILSLLGIRGGVVALTKSDLVEEDWLALVEEDVRAAVRATPLSSAPIVRTSVVTGTGVDALRAALAAAAASVPTRQAHDLFRLPVDRAFSVHGTGTVVTGTVWSGTVDRDAVVRLLPGGAAARVRGIETHGRSVPTAAPGTRAAIALAGVDVRAAPRGTMLVSDAGWEESRLLLADVALLASAPRPLAPRTAVRFHLGTAEIGARVVTAGGALAPGQRKQARIVLQQPVIARAGDRFVLRSASPLVTIGGGIVNDPLPPGRRARPWSAPAHTPGARLAVVASHAGVHGVPLQSLAVRLGTPPELLPAVLTDAGQEVRRIGDRLYDTAALDSLARRFLALVEDFHRHHPLEPGAPLQSVRARLGAEAGVVDAVLHDLTEQGPLALDGALVRLQDWKPRLTAAEERLAADLLAELQRAGKEPPSVGELTARFGASTVPLLRHLERNRAVVSVEAERFYARPVVDALITALREGMRSGQEYGPAELRDFLGVSRKFLIPFLEFCDRTGVTERRASGRVVTAIART
ncbi:MAG: selenocysteine-specific translation elongation factor [Gemmatimonadaceae bacterium]